MLRAVVLWCFVVLVLATGAAAQGDGRVLTVRVHLGGPVDDGPEAGRYYVAFSTLPGLLTGPSPSGENWTHYALYYRGRFFFATRRTVDLPPFLFRTTLPPEPCTCGSVSPDRKSLRVEVPFSRLLDSGRLQGPVKVNVVTTDRWNRPLDALGRGVEDSLGFVSFDPGRDVMVQREAQAGNAPPAYDVVGVEITLQAP
ncbi:MAG: hypothetical protein N0A24_11910 [Armatimonadetes bacterium]|nr:hypothetical protein [Armatimonadota bacterium]MDW8154874.1 hypothetical protein [Armatimonadota bacterium]